MANSRELICPKFEAYVRLRTYVGIDHRWSVSGGIGARRLTPAKDYNGINFGATYALRPATSLDLRYYDTDKHEYGDKNKPHLVLKLSQKF